jgi:hypothetical protein
MGVEGGGGERTKKRAEGGRRRGQTHALQVRIEELWGSKGGVEGWRRCKVEEGVVGGRVDGGGGRGRGAHQKESRRRQETGADQSAAADE